MEKTFSILTLGCKLNQFDSELMRQSLLRDQWEYRRPGEDARVYIINSCTVTGRSDARCRNAVRKTRRTAPGAFIVVTGCYAETEPHALSAMSEVDLVIGNKDKERIAAVLARIEPPARPGSSPGIPRGAGGRAAPGRGIESFLDHARAFVRIQDGCDAACSYCIVPRARGRSLSVPRDAIIDQIRLLRGNGYHEIVLTGIHIGRYGADLDPPSSLASLLEEILRETTGVRIRLSSLEPTEVSPRIVDLVRSGDRVARHLHIPLQSGDDRVLRSMNRPYDANEFRTLIERIARDMDDVCIGTDLITGFPGETDECFANTLALVAALPLAYLHVFAFSPRPGTPASSLRDQVRADVKKSRSRNLIDLGAAKKRAFQRARIGNDALVVVEAPVSRTSRYARSLTGNYCEVLVPRESAVPGTLRHVRITRFSGASLYGAFSEGAVPSSAQTGDDA